MMNLSNWNIYIYTKRLLKQNISSEINCYSSANDLLKNVEEDVDSVDIAILDIEIGIENGIDLAKKLLNLNPNIQVIFISGYYKYFQEVYYVKHISFVAKPINEDVYKNALEIAINNVNDIESHKPLIINNNQSIKVLKQNSIVSIERQKRKSIIHLYNKEQYECYDKLDNLLSKLNNQDFFRCHESYIINLAFIKIYNTYSVQLLDGTVIPVSRKYKNALKETFHDFIFKATFK